jgi:hypothetical protein
MKPKAFQAFLVGVKGLSESQLEEVLKAVDERRSKTRSIQTLATAWERVLPRESSQPRVTALRCCPLLERANR